MQGFQPKRRSDKVRRRLDEESNTSIKSVTKRVVDPGPAVSTGHPGSPTSFETEKLNQAKKGDGFFRIGWRLLSFLMVGFLSFALFTAWRSPEYKVTNIVIKGVNRLSEDEVLNTLNIFGKHIFALESSSIIESLTLEFPELRDIQVDISLPAKVVIMVVERQPMMAWQANDKRIWIDSEGFLIPARGETEQMLTIQANAMPAYHVIFRNEGVSTENVIRDKPQTKEASSGQTFFSYPKQIDSTLLTAVLQLNAWMPNESVLLYQEKRGIGWKDIRGWEVFVGSKLENINDKMLMYEMIVRKLEEMGIQPSLVSVEFLHAPYFRLDE